jgi:adenylate cyclase
VEVEKGYHLWSERYDREMKDVFDIQDEISANVVQALRGILKPEEASLRALDIDPDDAGVRYNVACLYSLEEQTEEAIRCLERAVEAGFGNRDWIEQDPDLNPLREYPRFQELVARL